MWKKFKNKVSNNKKEKMRYNMTIIPFIITTIINVIISLVILINVGKTGGNTITGMIISILVHYSVTILYLEISKHDLYIDSSLTYEEMEFVDRTMTRIFSCLENDDVVSYLLKTKNENIVNAIINELKYYGYIAYETNKDEYIKFSMLFIMKDKALDTLLDDRVCDALMINYEKRKETI